MHPACGEIRYTLSVFLEEVVDLVHKVQLAYNENLKLLQSKGMLPLFDAGYINMNRQYLTIGVNGLVEAAQFMGIEINDNPKYEAFVQEILGIDCNDIIGSTVQRMFCLIAK